MGYIFLACKNAGMSRDQAKKLFWQISFFREEKLTPKEIEKQGWQWFKDEKKKDRLEETKKRKQEESRERKKAKERKPIS